VLTTAGANRPSCQPGQYPRVADLVICLCPGLVVPAGLSEIPGYQSSVIRR